MRGTTIAVLLGVAACGTSSKTAPGDTVSTGSNTAQDVVVVGAGSAGLYAAKVLIAEGYDVLIIEATGRIGGRVKSATLGDMRVELGAEEHYLETGDNPVWPAIRGMYGEILREQAGHPRPPDEALEGVAAGLSRPGWALTTSHCLHS